MPEINPKANSNPRSPWPPDPSPRQNGNSRAGLVAIAGLIPIAAIMGAVFGAGNITAQVNSLAECSKRLEAVNLTQESRIMRLETTIERTAEDIREIKTLIRGQKP